MAKTNSYYTEDWIPVRQILNGMIALEDGEYVTGVKVHPRNIFIADAGLQNAIIGNLRNFYNSITFEFWLIIADRPVDIGLYLSQLQLVKIAGLKNGYNSTGELLSIVRPNEGLIIEMGYAGTCEIGVAFKGSSNVLAKTKLVITEKEEEALLEKLNNLYVKEDVEENVEATESEGSEEVEQTIFDKLEKGKKYDFYHDSKIRIRDIVKPYIIPSVITALIIVVYIAIRYKKLGNPFITVCKTLGEMLVILLEVLSIIAITRIPFTTTVIPIVMFIIIISLCIRFMMFEKELNK